VGGVWGGRGVGGDELILYGYSYIYKNERAWLKRLDFNVFLARRVE